MSEQTKGVTISYSKLTKIEYCPKSYQLYYEDRIRSMFQSTALLFGSAMDEALNRLLLEAKQQPTQDELKFIIDKSDIDVFDTCWNVVKDTEMVVYTKKDYDETLLENEDREEILKFILNNLKELYGDDADVSDMDIDPTKCVEGMIEFKSSKNTLNEAQHRLIAIASHASLRRKAHMLLKAYREQVLPQIEYVYNVQTRLLLSDDEGNTIEGIEDFQASFKDEPGVIRSCDNKTSSKAYAADSVATSDQLALYSTITGLDKAAYVVMEKDIRKKEPRVRISIIRGDISKGLAESMLDKFDNAVYTINSKEFPESGKDKGCRPFGQLCDYYGLCHKGSMDFLVKKEK